MPVDNQDMQRNHPNVEGGALGPLGRDIDKKLSMLSNACSMLRSLGAPPLPGEVPDAA
jgi:hypothetical protein